MQIIQLTVQNFRGIKHLVWNITKPVNCLVGPGDSTKTTILDAIELVLSPKWNVLFSDADFYNCEFQSEIVITATIQNPPEKWKSEDKFGLYKLGWDAANNCALELEDNMPEVVRVELKVDSSLEPEWRVTALDGREPRYISSKDREMLGVTRLGENIDRHVSWSRGSMLTRMGGDTKPIRQVIAEAQRQAIQAVRNFSDTDLHKQSNEVEKLARKMGVAPRNEYNPSLDAKVLGDGSTSLALHDGDVPLRLSGLGTRRLLAASIQNHFTDVQGALLIDEVEHGLEPHRIIHLVRTLTRRESQDPAPQVIMTTHSATVIAEGGAEGIALVRCKDGVTTIDSIPNDDGFAGLVRSMPEAFLGRRMLVCEGPTEGGLCWAIDEKNKIDPKTFGLHGVVVLDGGGNTKGPEKAILFARLGYDVAFFGDSDKAPNPSKDEMENAGVKVFLWSDQKATEERLFMALPVAAIQDALDLVKENFEENKLVDQMKTALSGNPLPFNLNIGQWLSANGDLPTIRQAIATAAKYSNKESKGWFKNWAMGHRLGLIVMGHFDSLSEDCPTKITITELLNWATKEQDEG